MSTRRDILEFPSLGVREKEEGDGVDEAEGSGE